MAIPTSRTKEKAEITILTENCTGCGRCVDVCSDRSLTLTDHKASPGTDSIFGCIGCGQCMTVCPTDAIRIHGRFTKPEDVFVLPPNDKTADYEPFLSLLQRRRSVRQFQDKVVDAEIIEKILDAARTAPMGLPPSDVNVLILDSKEKTHAFAKDFCQYLAGMKWFVSNWFLALMRPFWGKANDEMFRGLIKPLFRVYTEGMQQGRNLVNYDAPLAMYFYGSPYCDPADPVIAATYAMIAGESLGLGTCMLGSVHPLIQNGKKAKKFREDHKIKFKSREGLFVIFGYHNLHFNKGIRRTFASEMFL